MNRVSDTGVTPLDDAVANGNQVAADSGHAHRRLPALELVALLSAHVVDCHIDRASNQSAANRLDRNACRHPALPDVDAGARLIAGPVSPLQSSKM